MALSSLPLEVAQQIAECVERVHRPSIFALSLTSKSCHWASRFLIVRYIGFTVGHRDELHRAVKSMLTSLSRTESARHVHRISIHGALQVNPRKVNRNDQDTEWLRGPCLDKFLVDKEPIDYLRSYMVYDEPVIERGSEEDMTWAPVLALLQAVPHLKDLVYDCKSQLPPSLFSALRDIHPQCRLHHLSFRFRTLAWGSPYPYEMEIATYPALYRIQFACTLRDTEGEDDFNMEAMMDLVAGRAPNLKEVDALCIYAVCSYRYRRRRDSWRGLPDDHGGPSRGSLTSLSLKGYPDLGSPTLLRRWARCTDFACLKRLTLEGCHNSKTTGLSGETMDWLSRNHVFPKLRSLSVYLTRDDQYEEKPMYTAQAVSFFENLECLEDLNVHGPLDSHIIDAILSQHGRTLRRFKVKPFEEVPSFANSRDRRELPMEFTKDCLLQIQMQCPDLEELAIPIKRDRSSVSEADLYRCFSRMENLRDLFVTLDCSNWRVARDETYDPKFDDEDDRLVEFPTPLKRGHLKETLINCAVDESLAYAIWKAISHTKKGKRLERLRLWTDGGGEYGTGVGQTDITTIVRNLSRSWLVESVPMNDGETIAIRELGRQAREYDRMGSDISSSDIEQVFRAIWPDKENSQGWKNDWSSFPLLA